MRYDDSVHIRTSNRLNRCRRVCGGRAILEDEGGEDEVEAGGGTWWVKASTHCIHDNLWSVIVHSMCMHILVLLVPLVPLS